MYLIASSVLRPCDRMHTHPYMYMYESERQEDKSKTFQIAENTYR